MESENNTFQRLLTLVITGRLKAIAAQASTVGRTVCIAPVWEKIQIQNLNCSFY